MKNKITGILLLPLLYARWSFTLLLPWLIPALLKNNTYTTGDLLWGTFIIWVFYICIYKIVMSGDQFTGKSLLGRIIKELMRVLKVEYKECRDNWQNDTIHSGSAWRRDVIEIKGKRHSFSTPTMGGNSYPYDTAISRKILFTWLFN